MDAIKNALTHNTIALYQVCDDLKRRAETLEQYLFGKPDLWCVSMPVAGQLLAMRSREAAEKYAAEINVVSGGMENATVVESPWPMDVHYSNAIAVVEGWLDAAERSLTAQQIQIGRMRRHLRTARAKAS
ncbi:hypothetical protein [Stutzerimonas nitrititolerans]|uniref:hypothetical protein n=1 Tax=Stutzerimonas nitrititolerans TaxID=2482751 RepID=UPI0028AB397B|nr:hypothetical protein [Stutzerimonas nitrititolerans]